MHRGLKYVTMLRVFLFLNEQYCVYFFLLFRKSRFPFLCTARQPARIHGTFRESLFGAVSPTHAH